MNTKKILSLVIPITLATLHAESNSSDFTVIERDPFLQGGCLIPEHQGLVGVNIQALIDVDEDGHVKYKLIAPKKSKEAKIILDHIIKCPITIGTRKKRNPEDSPTLNVDGSFNYSFTPISLEHRKGMDRCFNAHYPYTSLALGEKGVTKIQFRIDSLTNASEIKISKSSGFAGLDYASLEHAKNCLSYESVKADIEKNTWIEKNYNWAIKEP